MINVKPKFIITNMFDVIGLVRVYKKNSLFKLKQLTNSKVHLQNN